MKEKKRTDILKKQQTLAEKICKQAEAIEVKNLDDYGKAMGFAAFLKKEIITIEEQEIDLVPPARKAYEGIRDWFKNLKSPFKSAQDIINQTMVTWTMKEQNRIAEEQRRADEKARKEEEKKKVQLAKKAEKLKEQGRLDEAEEIELEAETYVAPIRVIENTTKIKNEDMTGSASKDIEIVITDPIQIAKEVADGKLPVGVIKVQIGAIKSFAKLKGFKIGRYPGYIIKPKMTINVRLK